MILKNLPDLLEATKSIVMCHQIELVDNFYLYAWYSLIGLFTTQFRMNMKIFGHVQFSKNVFCYLSLTASISLISANQNEHLASISTLAGQNWVVVCLPTYRSVHQKWLFLKTLMFNLNQMKQSFFFHIFTQFTPPINGMIQF